MNSDQIYVERGTLELVFGTRSVFVPGRKVELGFTIRKKSAFPLVQELILKLLKTVGGSSLELLVTFFDFSEKEIREAIQPLLSKGFIVSEYAEYRLSDVGNSLFLTSNDGTPAINQSESLERNFRVDDHCGLPVEITDLGRHFKAGKLKWFIDEHPVDQSDGMSPNERVIRSFNESFSHFIKNEEDLERIRSEKMILHKTEYCRTKDNLILRSDVLGSFSKVGNVVNRVTPFDDLLPRSDQRRALRDQLVNRVKSNIPSGSSGEVEFFREYFGDDFLEGYFVQGVMAWFKLIPRFFKENWPVLKSGTRLVIGDAALPRNISLIIDLIEKVLSEREVSVHSPLKIVWIRPAVDSWGRSIGFLEAIEAIRDVGRRALKDAVQIELWERSGGGTSNTGPEQRSYGPWFNSLKRFPSRNIPGKTEMLLVGDAGGIVLTHAFSPYQSCFPCPIGVYFEEHPAFQELMKSEVHGGLRSLPRLTKKKKQTSKRGDGHQEKFEAPKQNQVNEPEEFS